MKTSTAVFASIIAVALSLASSPVALAVTDAEVQSTISKLVANLYKLQNAQGNWEPTERPEEGHNGHKWGGQTALVTYALLMAGESYQDPRMAKALEFLKTCDMTGVYSVGLRCHIWAALPPQFDKYLRKDVAWLQKAQNPTKGHFNYTIKAGSSYDNSVTQYGVLGMWEGAKRNVPIPRPVWEKVEKHFFECQDKSGGWAYSPGREGEVRGTMTAAGLASLYVTQDYLHGADFKQLGAARTATIQKKIDAGLDWFFQNFTAPGPTAGYYLYGVERVGLASGVKYFKGQDWYAAGAAGVVAKPPTDPINGSFCLLFLVRGRVPIFVNKVSIPDYDWNNRPRDVGRLVEWVSDESENKMIFQTVPIDVNPEFWLDAPIAYLASHKALKPTDAQAANIKRFIDLGGMLITTADGASSEFSNSVQQLQAKLFPGLKAQQVEKDDDLYTIVYRTSGDKLRPTTINNGIRHLWIHIPVDVSWALHSQSHSDPSPWQFFTNAYFYATEKGRVRPRLDRHFIARKEKGGGPAVTIARGVYHGNWNPEPLAWEVQSNVMFNANKATVKVKDVPLDQLTGAGDVKFLHVAGTEAVVFSDAQIANIKQFVTNGGTILFESAGGGPQFQSAVIEMLARAFPDNSARPISTSLPLISGKPFNGYDISKVAYRPYALLRMGQVEVPRLLAVSINNQPRIFISGEDLTFAMLNQPKWGVFGYTTDSAQKIMTNMVLNGAGVKAAASAPAPAPAPATKPAAPKPDAKKTDAKKTDAKK